MSAYKTVKELGESRFEDRKSVFIGYCIPVSTESDAISFITSVKKKYPDARHWVYAYVLRENSTMRFTDDREPQGTAGMPILDIIRKRELVDICVVVVRYFGGVLLGTGGLVHAYSQACLEAIESASEIRYSLYSTVGVTLSYSDHGRISPLLAAANVYVDDVEYLDSVTVILSCESSDLATITAQITELTSGRATVELIEEKYDFKEEN